MEDQINAAENATSISAEICQWSGVVFGVLLGLGFFWAEFQKNDLKSLPWWKPLSALVAGVSVSAHGSNVINNKRPVSETEFNDIGKFVNPAVLALTVSNKDDNNFSKKFKSLKN